MTMVRCYAINYEILTILALPLTSLPMAVTCIQFNPVDDDYFISGSLDAKVRIWNVPDRQVVDWSDSREMVTAASYTPDGQVPTRKRISSNFKYMSNL